MTICFLWTNCKDILLLSSNSKWCSVNVWGQFHFSSIICERYLAAQRFFDFEVLQIYQIMFFNFFLDTLWPSIYLSFLFLGWFIEWYLQIFFYVLCQSSSLSFPLKSLQTLHLFPYCLTFSFFSFILPVIVLSFLFFFVFLGMSCFPCSVFNFVCISIMVLFSFLKNFSSFQISAG